MYNRAMYEQSARRVQLENDMRKSIENNDFVLYYQPVVSVAKKKIVGFEALLRWQHPNYGLLGPGEFISLAEDTRMIITIGEWVLREACKNLKIWHSQGYSDLVVSVNISTVQFRQNRFIGTVAKILEENNIDSQFLGLELTESILMDNEESMLAVLLGLKNIGVELLLDDFGTGYSSLSYLKRFPFDILKIDRSFVSNLPDNAEDIGISKAIIAMGKSLKMELTAEGVETKEQYQFLKDLGCDHIQGYLFGKPQPIEKIPELLQNQYLAI